jgi:hypothetical protein
MRHNNICVQFTAQPRTAFCVLLHHTHLQLYKWKKLQKILIPSLDNKKGKLGGKHLSDDV